jgi:NADH-quinone oxidoreductase subunit G
MSEVTIKIDGVSLKAKEGESILNIARANGIFIPAICFLTRTSPSMACKLCMVEADGKRVYSCNAKAKDGMEVVVNNPDLEADRKAIMEVYCVNHPLQCGVCDKSGECELQDNVVFQDLRKQHYAIPDTTRHISVWGSIKYDGALCIMCKRCITVCKEMVGDSALKAIPRGGDSLDPEYKESMNKDPYGIWNGINKSLIDKVIKDPESNENPCTDCGECAAVCPTGAMITKDFQYTSNTWELESIPSTCAHCSIGCHLFYETKHSSIVDGSSKI